MQLGIGKCWAKVYYAVSGTELNWDAGQIFNFGKSQPEVIEG